MYYSTQKRHNKSDEVENVNIYVITFHPER
jgi:hypothetical protein